MTHVSTHELNPIRQLQLILKPQTDGDRKRLNCGARGRRRIGHGAAESSPLVGKPSGEYDTLSLTGRASFTLMNKERRRKSGKEQPDN